MTTYSGITVGQLKQFIERIERLNAEKKDIQESIKEVFQEAKGNGFDVPALREIIKLRAKDAATLEEEEHILDTYKRALGMLPELD